MRKIDLLLAEYGESHQDHTNKLIHWICVPVIFFTVLGLFYCIPFFVQKSLIQNWAFCIVGLALIYYMRLSPIMGIVFGLFSVVCLYGVRLLETEVGGTSTLLFYLVIIFIVAWIGQFIGHKIEGKKPSFLKDLQFLMIGPAWLVHFIFKKLSIPY